jgi:parallel beta-helix repeat protein
MRAVVILIMFILAAGVSYAVCREFSSPGAYSLDGDTYGANISISPLGGAFFTCIKISSSDVVLDCNGFLIDSNLTSSQRYGILVIGTTNSTVLSNITIRNCPRISRFGFPIYARNVTGLTVENVTIFNTTTSGSYGIALINCSNGNISGNSISDIRTTGTGLQQAGIFLNIGSHNNVISNNIIFNINGTGSSSRYGIESNFVTPVAGNFNNTISNNTIWNVNGAPIYGTNSSGMVVRNNYLFGSTGPGILLDRSENTTIAENNVYNITQDCSRFDTCRNATIANNTINVCGARGMLTQQMTYSNIVNNSVSNSSTGIEMSETNYTTLRNNALHGGTSYGIFMSGRSYYDQITNNTIQNYSSHGIYLVGASSTSLFYQSIIANNTISNNTGHGVFLYNYAAYSNVFNNTISGNGQDGVNAALSNLINVTQCRIFNNGGRGISMSGYSASDIGVINQTYLSNNSGQAIVFEGLQFANLRLTNAIIDSPAGSLTDYANLSLNDSLSSFSSYSFNWTGTPPSPPFTPFGKFVNISVLSGTVVLDAIAWHWLDSESSGHPETNFTIYKYNSTGWSKVPASIDIGANFLRATSVSPLSDFGILEGNESINCPVISGPGSFVQDMDYVGAPNSGSPVLNFTCVKITASDVVWDCNGFGITNNDTAGAKSGIMLSGPISNVTLKNCPVITGYAYGVYAHQSNRSAFTNNTANFDYAGFRFNYSSHNLIEGNNAHHNTQSGFELSNSYNNTIVGNNASNATSWGGIYLNYASNSTLANNTAFGNGASAIRIASSTNCTITNNTAYNNSFNSAFVGAIYLQNAARNRFIGNAVFNNTVGFWLDLSSDNNSFMNNSAYNNSQDGFRLNLFTTLNMGNNLSNNEIYNNANYGVNVMNSNRTFLSGDHFYNNGIDLFINHTTAQRVFNLSSVIFDSPPGNFTNYTNISVNDSSGTGTNNRYYFMWSSQPAALPPARTSFAGKFLTITRVSGANTLDRVAWHWLDSELNGTNDESRFMLYQYYGGWSSALNSSPDTSSNTLSLSSYNPNGIYGILEDTSIACPVYTSPGIYSLNQSYSGATNPASEIYFGALACIKIGSSDVVLDCNGYNITNDGTPDTTMGIVLNGSLANVTVKNCPNVSSYSYGIYAYDSNGGAFENITITNSSANGLTLDVANSNAISSMSFIDNNNALQFWSSGMNNLSSLAFDGNINGLQVFYSSNNNFTDLDFTGQSDSDDQIEFGDTSGNYLRNIHVSAAADIGFDGVAYFSSTVSDVFDNLTIDGAPTYGISLSNATGLTVQNSLINSTDIGIYLYSISTDNKFINTTISGSSSEGVYLSESSGNEFSNVTIYGTGYEGFFSYDSSPIIRNCHFFSNNPDLVMNTYAYQPSLTMEGTIFDNPAGDYQNFTNLSINDTLDNDEYYAIFWAQNASPMPADYVSFGNKFVNITPSGGSPSSIDTLVWSWLDSELGGYDETRFAIFRFNGTWAPLPSTLDAGANTLAISNLDAFSQFGPLENQTAEENITGQQVELFGVNVTNQSLPRWEGSSYAGNATTAPGNLTMANISASMLTDHWAAYFGNISTMDIILGDNASVLVYSWIWDASNDSVLCVSTNSSVHTFEAFPGKRANVDSAWSFDAAASDSANNTFTGTNCTLDLGASSISDMDYADTGYPGGFRTCLLKMAISPIKDPMLFCTKTISNSTLWNDETGDFELLVPTPYAPGPNGYETYYFYMASPG